MLIHTGNLCGVHLLQLEKAYDLRARCNECDWVVVFNILRIEAAVKAGKFVDAG